MQSGMQPHAVPSSLQPHSHSFSPSLSLPLSPSVSLSPSLSPSLQAIGVKIGLVFIINYVYRRCDTNRTKRSATSKRHGLSEYTSLDPAISAYILECDSQSRTAHRVASDGKVKAKVKQETGKGKRSRASSADSQQVRTTACCWRRAQRRLRARLRTTVLILSDSA